jgi:dienelactone hydrolase
MAGATLATLMLALVASLSPARPVQAVPDREAPTATEVSFIGAGGLTLHGTVLAPGGAPAATARRPAMVLLQGAGNRGRQELSAEADAFARHGIVSLIYDKRTRGYSLFHRDYSLLADDALAGLRLLRSRADVDPDRLGMWALSEGAFVAPLAANRSTDVKFLITVGAVGITPAAQTAWGYGQYLRHAGVSGSLTRTMQVTAVRVTAGAGLFPEANFDPVPVWQRLRQPVLAQWGALDREAVPQESSQIIRQALERGGNTRYTIRFVPGAGHDLNLTASGGFGHTPTHALAADYGDFETSWLDRPASRPQGIVLGTVPDQDRRSHPVTPLAWYESPWLQLAALTVLLAGFAGYPLTAVVRRILGRRGAPPVHRSARWLAATGLITTVGSALYLFFMLATAANIVGPVLLGRPLPWLLLQLFAVATLVATATTATEWRRQRGHLARASRLRLGLLLAAGLAFVPYAAYWGLLIP